MRIRIGSTIVAGLLLIGPARADEPQAAGGVPPVPATRQQMKEALEASKRSTPRLPLPPLSAEERERAEKGDWAVVNNGRMRKFYLPPELTGAGFIREPDPAMSLGHPFQTMLFWIVSRGNNCTYCMGHQESKLAAAGVSEDLVAALDGDWAEYSDAQRAAFGLARKLTFEPYAIADADIERLKGFYNPKQILEIVLVTANFNAMNRWTGALKIPQEGHRVYLTPTAEKYRDRASRVAPLAAEAARRPAPESAAEVEAALSACRSRSPRLPLLGDDLARAALPKDWPAGPLPAWVRLLATFPKAGVARIVLHRDAETAGTLDRTLRAEVACIAAREDRAWYALGHARARLAALGVSADRVAAREGSWEGFPPADRAAFALARKLTAEPARVSDADIAGLRKHFSDKEVAELVYQVTEAAFFDRVTEAAGLPLEAEAGAR